MVHLAISFSTMTSRLRFRVIQTDQYPLRAEQVGVRSTPTLVLPNGRAVAGNLPARHFAFHVWQAAMGL